jgi:hypothetical protein
MEDKEIGSVDDQAMESTEKSLTTSQVNDIVKREKARAAEAASERTRQELEGRHREEIERLTGQQSANSQSQEMDTSGIEQRVYDKFMGDLKRTHEEQLEAQRVGDLRNLADQYHLKMGKGSELFEDFNEVIAPFRPEQFPNTVMLVAEMENTPEIMYELAKNPEKLVQINSLAERSPEMARLQLKKLADSINANLEAKQNNVNAPPPLSRPKSSSVAMDNGNMSLEDLKKQPWLRA